jgi:hypothetical protein
MGRNGCSDGEARRTAADRATGAGDPLSEYRDRMTHQERGSWHEILSK